jgi:hypoxanthine-DNA glycosylase
LETLVHPWGAVYDSESRILILGTFPSPKSRENGFPYGHPQNIFWPTLAEVLGKEVPAADAAAKKMFLLENHVALWDVLHSCKIDGASDSSIREPVANKFKPIIESSKITKIFTTGKKATELFEKYCTGESGLSPIYLPSTSPANRALQAKPEFKEAWSQVSEAILEKSR